MVGGIERYFQIARCFRDEDLRADRQPEFTQIDFEMSFVDEEDVIAISEGLIHYIFKKVLGIELKIPFRRMTYKEAIEKYGTDKPDIRYELHIVDITDVVKDVEFKVFRDAVQRGGIIKGLTVEGGASFSRRS